MNIRDYADQVTEYYSPKIIGKVTDLFVKIAKINSDKVTWHNHTYENEFRYAYINPKVNL